MDKTIHSVPTPDYHLPEIHSVTGSRPLRWLATGWHDFLQAPVTSLIYGAVFAALGWGLFAITQDAPTFAMTYVAGFFLLGPFLASGLYAVAHRVEHHKPANLYHALTSWHRSGLQMGIYAAMIAIVMMFWIRFAWLMIGMAFTQGEAIGIRSLIEAMGGEGQGFNYLILYAAFGALFAAFVFTISVVALPMLQDRRVDIVTAMLTSLKAVRTNPTAMIVWAALIVALSIVGFALFIVGLAVIFPVLGYATWHAYRDMVPRQH